MSIHITTKMRGKMKGMVSISTTKTSRCYMRAKNPKTVCSKCYVDRTPAVWSDTVKACFERNAKILRTKVLPTDSLPVINVSYCRLESLGELENTTQLINYYNIAKVNPRTRFVLWTKEVDIVNKVGIENKPKNVRLIYSSPLYNVRAKLPKGFSKVFTVYTKDKVQSDKININCGGKSCISCLLCYGNSRIKYINELAK